MSVPFPPLPSYLPPDLPPLPPPPDDIRTAVLAAQETAKSQGEKAGAAGLAERRRLEAMGPVRAQAVAASPVPAPEGVWMVALRLDDDEIWWALRPVGGGRVEAWDGRALPRTYRVKRVRPRSVRRSRLRLTLDDGPTRKLRVGTDRGLLSQVGLPATPWYRTGGGDDPIAGVVLILAGVWWLLTLPIRIGPVQARARTRDALAAALRG